MAPIPAADPAVALKLMAGIGVATAGVLAWLWSRERRSDWAGRRDLLLRLTVFLTFDLVVFGSFTRLTDSGLGCPDWPGCYGKATPWGAGAHIDAAQAALPDGPVTWTKAWIEMIHRYLAMTVGALVLVLAVLGWWRRREFAASPWWPTLTLAWVLLQGLFGRYTVTLKLYPAIVTLHLLGGLVLLGLLVAQLQAPAVRWTPSPLLRRVVAAAFALLALQIALGGWVSTNYAVLACDGFPQCNGRWWPQADWDAGFTLVRELGRHGAGYLPFDALVAIHWAHRLVALPAALALLWLGGLLALRRDGGRNHGFALLGLVLLQAGSGLSNVVLGWPLLAAVAHAAGAAALVALMVALALRSRGAPVPARASVE